MSLDLGLGSLLAALRQAGLRVGVVETTRLQHVFSLSQDLSGDKATRFKSILRAVLAKDTDERETIDRVVDTWVGRADRELDFPGGPQHPVLVLRSRSKSRSWRVRSLAALLVLVFAALLRPLPERSPPILGPPPSTLPEAQVSELPASVLPEAQDLSTRTFQSEVPVLEVIMPQPVWTGWTPLGLGALAAVSALGLWFLRNRRWLPEPAPMPERKGPPRVFLSPPNFLEPQLLEPRQQEALVWGISRFVAEEPTRHVDLPASVRATVRAGGLPEIRYQKARHFREVWLWVDESADDPALPRLADEVEQVLRRHGLPVERASFRGTPQLLVAPSGHVFAPGEVDELRDTALVAVLTDGRVLARQYTADDRRVVLNALLRGLSHWPHLVFVDFSVKGNDLLEILTRHDLEVISPASLPDFLGTGSQTRTGTATPQTWSLGEDEAWAATAALAPAPIDEATAFDLRRHLGLRISPWALRALLSEASGPPGFLWWSVPLRVQRLGWLSAAEQHVGEVAPGSLLARALDFWEGVYDQEIRRRQGEESAAAWAGTPAQQHLLMERALLRLWRRPREAARELYTLYRGALQEVIRSHLAILAPAGRSSEEQVELPWRWEGRSTIEKAMLQAMGLGGELPAATLHRPGRLLMAIGTCGGLALGTLALSVNSDWIFPGQDQPFVEPTTRPGVELRDSEKVMLTKLTAPNSVFRLVQPSPAEWKTSGDGVLSAVENRFYRVSVSNRSWVVSRLVPPGAKIRVRWRTEERPCTLKEGTTEIWRCGANGYIRRPPLPGIQRSIAIVDTSSRPLGDVHHLATFLLDTGSADVVALSSNWTHLDLSRLLGPALSNLESQVLFFSSAETVVNWSEMPDLERLKAKKFWVRVDWERFRLVDFRLVN